MTKKKYRQTINRKTRAAGSSGMDTEDKNKVKKILQAFGAESVHYDVFVGITMDDRYNLYQHMTQADALPYRKIRHPDVVAYFGATPYIVEIDGAYHKDFDYDRDYDDVKIAYIKINKWYMKTEHINWHEWILADLIRRGIKQEAPR